MNKGEKRSRYNYYYVFVGNSQHYKKMVFIAYFLALTVGIILGLLEGFLFGFSALNQICPKAHFTSRLRFFLYNMDCMYWLTAEDRSRLYANNICTVAILKVHTCLHSHTGSAHKSLLECQLRNFNSLIEKFYGRIKGLWGSLGVLV